MSRLRFQPVEWTTHFVTYRNLMGYLLMKPTKRINSLSLNPYGFAHLRRVNEQNIDLNRNFLLPGERFEGADPTYASLDGLLNPTSPPQRGSCFGSRRLARSLVMASKP